jgi:hypothetical protein
MRTGTISPRWLQLNAVNLAGSVFLNFALLALTEMPSVFVGQFTIDRLGRRWCHFACMFLTTGIHHSPTRVITKIFRFMVNSWEEVCLAFHKHAYEIRFCINFLNYKYLAKLNDFAERFFLRNTGWSISP